MDPQLKSVLTTIAATLSASVAGAAATHGVIHSDQQAAFADIVTTVAGVAVTALIGWYKARQNSQSAMIQAVNAADNGVKVVPVNSTTTPPVQEPLK